MNLSLISKNELGERVGVALGTAVIKGKGQPGTEDTHSKPNLWELKPHYWQNRILRKW